MIAAAPVAAHIAVAPARIANGARVVVSYRAARAGRVRIVVRRGGRCPAAWHGGMFLFSGITNRVIWRDHLDQVNRPGRYTVCATVRARGRARFAVGARLAIRPR